MDFQKLYKDKKKILRRIWKSTTVDNKQTEQPITN